MNTNEIEKLTLRYISRYNKTKHGVKTYLMQKIPFAKEDALLQNSIDDVLDRFESKGYINDLNYAIFKISGKIKSGKSVNFVKNYLFEKHIEKTIIELAFEELLCKNTINDLDKLAIIKLCQNKKLGPWNKDEENSKNKDFNKLTQRGFFYSNIEYVLGNNVATLQNELNELENNLLIF